MSFALPKYRVRSNAQLGRFFETAIEREHIRRKRASGEPWPWTDDLIFRDWRFCNVRREDDETTQWFRENIRHKFDGVFDAVFATIAFRWFNRIDTGEIIKPWLLDGWDRRAVESALRKKDGPIWTGSYRINTPPGDKLAATLNMIEGASSRLDAMIPHWGHSLERAWIDLQTIPRMGSFCAYEVVSDLRWTSVLSGAKDINTWAAAGPGCARGLGLVISNTPDFFTSYNSVPQQEAMLEIMRELLEESRSRWPFEPAWEMREVEHWACEYDKYERTARSCGRPRRRFTSRA